MPNVVSFSEAAEQVKHQLDVLETIGKFVSLKKRGRSHLGLCPFHKEKTPSFNVAADKGFFKCFGCGESGDAISFLMKIENKTYGEVIREQAEELGLSISFSDQKEDQAKYAQKLEERERLWDVLKNAASWFHGQLTMETNVAVRDYLTARGVDDAVISRYQLGYAPESWDALTTYLLSASPHVVDDQTVLERASVASARDNGNGYYDKFRNRLIVPILDARGRHIGFGGRALGEDQQPKYLNSSESLVYQKSETLYGFFQAKEAIRTHHRAVVMEGYFDVIASQVAGVEEAVATCGTALTEAHITLLLKAGVETLYLCFDSDKAGRNAALSAIERLDPWIQRQKLKIRVVRIPDGKDPDDYFKHHSLNDFHALMKHAPDALSFRFDCSLEGINLHTSDGQLDATQRLMPLLAKVKHPVIRAQLVSRYSERLRLGEDVLRQALNSFEGKMPFASGNRSTFQQQTKGTYNKATGRYDSRKPALPPEDFTHLRQQLVAQQRLPALEQRLIVLAVVHPDVFSGLKKTLFTLPWQSKVLAWLWEQVYPLTFDEVQPYLHTLWQQAQTQKKEAILHMVQRVLMEHDHLKEQLHQQTLTSSQLLEMTNQCLHQWQKRYHQEVLTARNTQFRSTERNGEPLDDLDETDVIALSLHYDVLETQNHLLPRPPENP